MWKYNILFIFRCGGPVDDYVDMTPRKHPTDQNPNYPSISQHRGRTSTIPADQGGSFLATEKLSNPSIFSFREQNQISGNVYSDSLTNIRTWPTDIYEENLLDTKCPGWANQCKCEQNKETSWLPWKKRQSIQVHSRFFKKSSSKMKLLLTIALFILAFVTGIYLFFTFTFSITTNI